MEKLLDDLTSRDRTRIWSASSAINQTWDRAMLGELAKEIAQIREQTAGIELGGALHPNSVHLSNAIARLEFVRDGKGCLCTLNGSSQFTDPTQEAAAGRLRILETVMVEAYPDHYACECLLCGARYKVIERSYHYTWWGWERG